MRKIIILYMLLIIFQMLYIRNPYIKIYKTNIHLQQNNKKLSAQFIKHNENINLLKKVIK